MVVVIIQNPLAAHSTCMSFLVLPDLYEMRSSNYMYAEQLTKATRGPRRELAIDSFSQASSTSVWYYRVNVSVYEEVRLSTFIDEDVSDGSSNEDDSSSGASMVTTAVEHYSILRRYSDFLKLYQQMRDMLTATEGSTYCLPSFPAKEFISPALVGMLRRVSSSKVVLEDRSAKFETLLRWIENHPAARNCRPFVEFMGKPPQSHGGYVSLKEYTPPDWLLSLQQTTNCMESRRRRYSTGSSSIQSRLERSKSEVSESLARPRCEHFESARKMSSMRGMTKVPGSYDRIDRYSV